jgi:DNA polymerase-3 subunit alpha
VRFGMAAVKGVGKGAVQNIIEERASHGPYRDMYDFVTRVNLTSVNRKTLESLALAGAFDSIAGFHRSRFFATDSREATFLENLVRYGTRMQEEKSNAQQSLFGGGGAAVEIQRPVAAEGQQWSKPETLNREKEVIGIYLSAHPLDEYRAVIRKFCNTSLADFADLNTLKNKDFAVAGIITRVQIGTSRTGKPYGRITVEDYSDSYEFSLWGKDFERFRLYFFEQYYVLIRGRVSPKMYNENEFEPKVSAIAMLSDVQENGVKELMITLPIEEVTGEFARRFAEAVAGSPGRSILRIRIRDSSRDVSLAMTSRTHKVKITNELIGYLENNGIPYVLA